MYPMGRVDHGHGQRLAESEKLGVREVMGILINAGKIGAYLLLTHMTLQIKKMPGFWTSFMA
jgi:hypothetical protein